jgi:hypothetical protein
VQDRGVLAWSRVLGTALVAARNPLHFFATVQGGISPEESTPPELMILWAFDPVVARSYGSNLSSF